MLEKLRSAYMVPVWTIVRVWLGIQWLTAGWHKAMDGFDATGFITGAIAKAAGEKPVVQGWYAAFLEGFALPNVELFNFLVAWGEVAVGLGLILGTFTTIALYAGIFMNLNFLLAGTISTNPILYTVGIILLAMGAATYSWGVDRYMIPWLKASFNKTMNREHKVNT
ncbi:DoxX family membrane protein [Ammoniphilus sp. 3BR4]|uniref:DoxX family membrane protein n=1 Tax=Ammoniphilus sp. 3BR4 TaxID=3158265 RepID=UPI00346550ED